MSTLTTDRYFQRRVTTLWRDTGQHVLVLPPEESSEVTVLGGGSAVLWRMLVEPQRVEDLVARLGVAGGDSPSEEAVGACLHDLVDRGLVVDRSLEDDAV